MRRTGVVQGNAEWEAMKAARRNLNHDDAVWESDFLQKQYRSLWRSHMPPSPVDIYAVLRTLIQKRIPFVLTGATASAAGPAGQEARMTWTFWSRLGGTTAAR